MRRTGVFVFIAAGLLVLGAVFLWLAPGEQGGGDTAALVATPSGPGASDARGPDLPAATSAPAAPTSASLEEIVTETEAVVASAPASYLKALGALTGRVVEATPGADEPVRPVPGLTIELAGGRKSTFFLPRDALLDPERLELQVIAASAVTDADGRFTFERLDPRTIGALLIDPGGPRGTFWPLEITPVGGETRDLGDLLLPASATLVGLVVDERGEPIAGARVRATDLPLPDAFAGVADFRAGGGVLVSDDDDGEHVNYLFVPPPSLARLESRLPLPTAFTGADGAFELTGVPPGLVALAVDDGVHAPVVQTGVATGAAEGRRDVGTVPMADGLPLAVSVRGSDGKPVPSFEVLAGSTLPLAPIAIMKQPTRREPDGSAQFTGLAAGAGWVAARTDSRHDFTLLAVPQMSVGQVELRLESPHDAVLTVLDADGLPVSDAAFFGRVVIDSEMPDLLAPPQPLADRTRADPDSKGRYVIADLEPAEWELTTIAPGRPQHRLSVDLSLGDASAEVRLPRGAGLGVRVLSATDGAPVEWALVETFPADDGLELNLFDGPAAAERTDATGLARFEALPPGELSVSVTHPGFAITQVSTELPTADELQITLSEGAHLTGLVLDQGGPPAEPLLIMCMPQGGPDEDEMPRFTVCDLEGRFSFARVQPGEVELQARSRHDVGPGLSMIESLFNSPLAETSVEVAESGETEVVLVVGAGQEDLETGFITGQLSVNGAPASGWKVRTWGEIRRSASTDAQGKFDLGRVEAGEVSLLLSGPAQTLGNGFTDAYELTLQPDEQRWVSIALSTGGVSGRVVSAADGQPLGGVEVSANAATEPQDGWSRRPGTISATDGSFVIEPVVAGSYRVSARGDGYARSSSEIIDISAFERHEGLVLRLPQALAVSGTITLEGLTEEPEWMWLMATGGASGEDREGARITPETRSFEFERLGPGEWTFEVSTSLNTEFETVKHTLTESTKTLALVFTPLPPDQEDEPGASVFKVEVK